MDWNNSINCQNCVALNKKLELFELLKQKCSRTDDIAKNLLVLKKSCEKSAKVLDSKSKKLTEVRNKLKELVKGEESLKGAQRKVAEYQLRLVSLDTNVQDLEKNVAEEQHKYATLQKEKQVLEELLEQKENENAAFTLIAKQCEERLTSETQALRSDLEKFKETAKKGKKELQILQKSHTAHKKKYDRIVASLLEIFKDGETIVGEPLTKLKRLVSRLQSKENAAKLEAELNSPSMTPDGTTSLDTGIFSDDENFSNPSLGNDLQISSESSDEDFEAVEVPSMSKLLTNPLSKKKMSNPSIDNCSSDSNPSHTECLSSSKSPIKRFHGKCKYSKSPKQSVSNFCSDSLDESSSRVCPSTNESDVRITNVQSPVEISTLRTANFMSSCFNETQASFPLANDSEKFDINALKSPAQKCRSLTSPLSSPNKNYVALDSFPSKSPVREMSAMNLDENLSFLSALKSCRSLASPSSSPIQNIGSLDSSPSKSPTKTMPAMNVDGNRTTLLPPKSPIKHSQHRASRIASPVMNLPPLDPSLSKSPVQETSSMDMDANPAAISALKSPVQQCQSLTRLQARSNNSTSLDSSLLSTSSDKFMAFGQGAEKYIEPVDGITDFLFNNDITCVNPDDASNRNGMSESTLIDDEKHSDIDLELVRSEWNTPTLVTPFSEDSCDFDGKNSGDHLGVESVESEMELQFTSSLEVPCQDDGVVVNLDVKTDSAASTRSHSPPRVTGVTKISVSTSTEHLEFVSTASSPIFSAGADFQCETCARLKDSERSDFQSLTACTSKDAATSDSRLFASDKATSPVRFSFKDVGLTPVKELRRDSASSPIKNGGKNFATSPVRSLFKNSAVSPMKLSKQDIGTSPIRVQMKNAASNFPCGTDKSIQASCGVQLDNLSCALPGSTEANMLQQIVEIFGINPNEMEDVAVDQTLINEVQCAIRAALRKTYQADKSSISSSLHPRNSGINGFCPFNPCEFAEICNQQHYNLHLLAKSKNLEKKMCLFGTRNKHKVKRLQHSNRKGKKKMAPSFKEDILEPGELIQKSQISHLKSVVHNTYEERKNPTQHETASFMNMSSENSIGSRRNNDETHLSSEGIFHLAFVEERPKKVIHANNSACHARPNISEPSGISLDPISNSNDKDKIRRSSHPNDDISSDSCNQKLSADVPAPNTKSPTSSFQDPEQNCTETGNFLGTSHILSTEGHEPLGPFGKRNTKSFAAVKDCPVVDVANIEHVLSLDHKENDMTPADVQLFSSHPKAMRKSPRKRQSMSSESSISECAMSDGKERAPLRRSTRVKKTRVAHDCDSGIKQSYEQGYSKFVKGDTIHVSPEAGLSQCQQAKEPFDSDRNDLVLKSPTPTDQKVNGLVCCMPVKESSLLINSGAKYNSSHHSGKNSKKSQLKESVDLDHSDPVEESAKQLSSPQKNCGLGSEMSVEEDSLLTHSPAKSNVLLNSGQKSKKSWSKEPSDLNRNDSKLESPKLISSDHKDCNLECHMPIEENSLLPYSTKNCSSIHTGINPQGYLLKEPLESDCNDLIVTSAKQKCSAQKDCNFGFDMSDEEDSLLSLSHAKPNASLNSGKKLKESLSTEVSDTNLHDSVLESPKQASLGQKKCNIDSDTSDEDKPLVTFCSENKKAKKSRRSSKRCAVAKRSTENESAVETCSKRYKLSVESQSEGLEVMTDHLIPNEENKINSNELNSPGSAGEGSKLITVVKGKVVSSQDSVTLSGQVRSSLNKPSKLQKLRSSVSKIHPLAQAPTSRRRGLESEVRATAMKVKETNEAHLLEASVPMPNTNAIMVGPSEAQISVLEKLRARSCQRMAAAASGRTAQLIKVDQFKPSVSRTKVEVKRIGSHPSQGVAQSSKLKSISWIQPLVLPEDRLSAGQNVESKCNEVSKFPKVPSEATSVPTLSVRRASRVHPSVRSKDCVSAVQNEIVEEKFEETDRTPEISSGTVTRLQHCTQSENHVLVINNVLASNEENECEEVCQSPKMSSGDSSVSKREPSSDREANHSSFLISQNDVSKVTTLGPVACVLADHQIPQAPPCDKNELNKTEKIVEEILKKYVAASSFTPQVLETAITALSVQELYYISPVIVRDVVKMVEDDFDSSPLRLPGARNSFAPSLTPVQQQLVTLVLQLSFQNKHLKQLPHQLLGLVEYRMFRLGKAPEGGRLIWFSRLYASLCRALCLRAQALVFCYDSLYAFRGRSYEVVEAVLDVWPHLFPIKPSFDKACPNAQVILHLLCSHSGRQLPPGMQLKNCENSWLKQMLRRLQLHSINSSILSSKIFVDMIGGGVETNVTALVLLAKREDEHWAVKDIINGKLLPALDRWHNDCLDDLSGEKVVWSICSILRAMSLERGGGIVNTLIKLLKSDLLHKGSNTVSPHMQEVIAIGLALLSRHDIENIAVQLMKWSPTHGPTEGYSAPLLQYLKCLVTNGIRPISWWRNYLKKLSKFSLEEENDM